MSYIEFLQKKESWEAFLEKEELREFKDEKLIRQIKRLLEKETYLKFTESYLEKFAYPKLIKLSKYNTSKKRIVYVYPGNHMLILKITSFYILKKYSKKFSSNSLAYIEGRSVKSVFHILKKFRLKESDIVYKNDFSDYFNSIPIDKLDLKLKEFLRNDMDLYSFIMRLLTEPKVRVNGKLTEDHNKGVMAGSPIAGILANIYMHQVDIMMKKKRFKYIRYADDTLIVGQKALDFFKEQIESLDITFNPKKMQVMSIKTGITFLGFLFVGKTIDISKEAKDKMKSRFKRRAKWYRQWMLQRNVKKEVAIKDYIKKINFKLYSDQDDSINWSRWYLPNINIIDSIKFLDNYFVDCIRYLDSGTWTRGKKFYRLSYEEIKELGYRSLVNEYYSIKRNKKLK